MQNTDNRGGFRGCKRSLRASGLPRLWSIAGEFRKLKSAISKWQAWSPACDPRPAKAPKRYAAHCRRQGAHLLPLALFETIEMCQIGAAASPKKLEMSGTSSGLAQNAEFQVTSGLQFSTVWGARRSRGCPFCAEGVFVLQTAISRLSIQEPDRA